MKVIIIEDMVYKVPDKIFKRLDAKMQEIKHEPYRHGTDMEMHELITSLQKHFKEVGRIWFDFRL